MIALLDDAELAEGTERTFELREVFSGKQEPPTAKAFVCEWNADEGRYVATAKVMTVVGSRNDYGLVGEQGRARWTGDHWQITQNPGHPMYTATAWGGIDCDATEAMVNVVVEGVVQSVTARVPDGMFANGKFRDGGGLTLVYSNVGWTIFPQAKARSDESCET